ncbi:FRG domain-containing protein [Arthrobacter sp. KNU-44]|uniref:FRG domain-containing protein n=1 Tax=Arthrobacter sp. KNU-44 TaxID=3450744 RepID=UPI003F429C84
MKDQDDEPADGDHMEQDPPPVTSDSGLVEPPREAGEEREQLLRNAGGFSDLAEAAKRFQEEREQLLRNAGGFSDLAEAAKRFQEEREQLLRNAGGFSDLAEAAKRFQEEREQLLRNAGGFSDLAEAAKRFQEEREQLLRNAGGFSDLAEAAKRFQEEREQLLRNFPEFSGASEQTFARTYERLRAGFSNLSAARSLHYRPLKSVGALRTTAYSTEMTTSSTYFEQWETTVDSFEEFQSESAKLMDNNPDFSFLWRGQRDADWPLHSSLFRELCKVRGVRAPHQEHRTEEPFPTEADMVRAEMVILGHIRENWRFDDSSAMSTFARLQHFGAPTRLIDVSRNPLIAAWFATEANGETDEKDCRIFALATSTLPEDNEERSKQKQSSRISQADASYAVPFWHVMESDEKRGESLWGTGRLRRFWIPPLYESRISAQNAGFILDGVPLDSPDLDKYFLKPGGKEPWKIADRLAGGSISIRFSHVGKPVGRNLAKQLPPTFTIRITAKGKREIRRILNDRYSYSHATIYPDIQGAAEGIRYGLKDLIAGNG